MDMRGRLVAPTDMLAFVLAGRAVLTLRSVSTQKRYTYRVDRAPGEDAARPWFVKVLYGPDNTGDYTYVGLIRFGSISGPGAYEHGAKSRLRSDDPRSRAFDWFYRHIRASRLPPGCEVWHEGRCGRCARPLTVPESIARGLGPECAGIITQGRAA